MRLNLGIRRRLAPLLDNDGRKIELMNGMLMSLPGTPIIYYGDEIGMGDNVNLGDRNGVRTPMQWDGGWNGGFSPADPESLYAPLLLNPVYGFQAINVQSQRRFEHSLLSWMKRLIRVSEDLVFHQSAIDNLRHLLAGRKAVRFSVGAFKDWTGISRKYAIPLLEYLDRERFPSYW